jgi:hypothetical protein
LGITVRPIEMMSPDLRVLGAAEGLPTLPDTQYSLCKDLQCGNELAMAIFSAMQNGNDNYSFNGPSSSLQDDTCLVDDEE